MHTLHVLLLTVAASLATARPPGPASTTAAQEEAAFPTRKYLKEYLLPRFLLPHYFAFDEYTVDVQEPRPPMPATELLNQEIERLTRLHMANQPEIPARVQKNFFYMKRWPHPEDSDDVHLYYTRQEWPTRNLVSEEADREMYEVKQAVPLAPPLLQKDAKKKKFALTPRDQGFFEPIGTEKPSDNTSKLGETQRTPNEVAKPRPELEPEPPRKTRQNPNLSRHHQMSLIAENLDNLRAGFSPSHEESGSIDSSRHVSALDGGASGSPGTFYGVALLSAIGAAAVLAIFGFAVAWYTLSKRAKAAADVDYPAYGVTGPTIDPSGDRKLAHSAHMYHYQHQKQQIIAMERSGMEQRSESVSDPESDDENEEGDYTVYECPGFATTGNMEVKNPLFQEPTPATPGKCELVKPQPKN